MKRAFTLVELVVVATLILIFVVIGWSIFSRLTSQDARAGDRVHALQAALVVIEGLEKDLSRVAFDLSDPQAVEPVKIGAAGRTLEAAVFILDQGRLRLDPSGRPQTEALSYRHDAARSAVVRRDGAGRETVIRAGSIADLTFQWDPASVPPSSRLITYRVETLPETALRLPPAQRPLADRMVFVGSVPLRGLGERQRFPEWVPTVLSIPVAGPVAAGK